MYLTCDLGGTTCEWGVFDPRNNSIVFQYESAVAEAGDFYGLLNKCLDVFANDPASKSPIVHATFAVAGVVEGCRVKPTNIEGWEIDAAQCEAILAGRGFDAPVVLLNDFESLGLGLLHLGNMGFRINDYELIHGDLAALQEQVSPGATSIICGPGTGLGVACIVDDLMKGGHPYIVHSEGGHVGFAPESEKQLTYMSGAGRHSIKRLSNEDVLCGRGLQKVDRFFRSVDSGAPQEFDLRNPIEIVRLSKIGNDRAAVQSVTFFAEKLAGFCGDMANVFCADKAVFLWGSVLKDIDRDLLRSSFREIFPRRAHADRLKRLPVVIVTNENLPLLGCAYYSKFDLLHRQKV